ncbi:MAG TPA: hypothetical protein VMV03_10765 [Spirochaetia bacterium]|nr:hypothetical protein [Spirochaetia bacterium]
MKRLLVAALAAFLWGGGFLAATDEPPPQGPTLVLPQVTLDIQDLSIENVQAMLPSAREAPITQSQILLPSTPAFTVEAPARRLAVEGSDPLGGAPAAQRPLATQTTLGAGLQNRVIGRLNVATVGGSARANLSFAHETADGISGKAAGSGFDTRDDTIGGSISGKLGPVDGSFQGSYAEKSVGLQGQSPFISRLGRTLDGTAGASVQPLEWLTVDSTVTGAADTLTLAAGSPTQASEYRAGAHAGATARTGVFTAGVSGDFGFRSAAMIAPGAQEQVQRIRTGLSLGLDFPGSILLEGTAAWFLNTQSLSLFPFSLHLGGVTFSIFSFDVSAGFKVVPYDQEDILALSPYLLPVTLSDDNGWFVDGAVQLALPGDLSLKVGASFMRSAEMPDISSTPNGMGLFPVFQKPANRLTGDASLRWSVAPGITLDARWKREFLDKPLFVPLDQVTAEAIAMESTGAFGGQAAVTWLVDPAFSWAPVIDVGGFVRLSEAAQLHLDFYDVLWFLLNGTRYGPSISPYVEPGFRAVASIRLSF